jgi:hypothetical protein
MIRTNFSLGLDQVVRFPVRVRALQAIILALAFLGIALQGSSVQAASLSVDELRVLNRNDLFGSNDEVYLVITVARSDGSSYAYTQPMGGHWTLRAGQAVFNQPLWQEFVPLYGRALLTVTVLEKDGSSEGGIYLSASEFAGRVRNELLAAKLSPTQGALNPQFLSRLTPEVLAQNGRWNDDDVIGVYAFDYFNDGVQVRAGISPLYAGSAARISPIQTRASALGDGAHYGLTFQIRSY